MLCILHIPSFIPILHCIKFIFFGHLSSYKSSEYIDVATIQWNVDNLNLSCMCLLIAIHFCENRRIVYITFSVQIAVHAQLSKN